MKNRPTLSTFLSPERSIIRYVVGTAALTVVIQAIYDGLTARFNLLGAALLGAILVAAVLFMLWLDARRARPPELDARIEPSQPHLGLILMVSPNNTEVPLQLIEHHASILQQLWLVSTEDSLETADKLVGIVHSAWPEVIVHPTDEFLVDTKDPRSTWETIRRIYEHSDLPSEAIIADITGGNKTMTAGMSIACISPARDMQYLYTPKRKPDGTLPPSPYSVPIQISTHWIQERSTV